MTIPSSRGRKPRTQRVSVRSVSLALSGPEQPYPVYHFSRRVFIERPGHNPFAGLVVTPGGDAWGESWGDSWDDGWDT